MSFIQIVDALRTYRADALLLALAVTLLTSLLKKTVMKSCNKKVFVFLPFLIGIVLFALYRALATWSAAPLCEGIVETLYGGMECGIAAILYYVFYEQFFRGKKTASPIEDMLECIPEKERKNAAKRLYEESEKLGDEELYGYFAEHLNEYASPPLGEIELAATAEILAAFLVSLRTAEKK